MKQKTDYPNVCPSAILDRKGRSRRVRAGLRPDESQRSARAAARPGAPRPRCERTRAPLAVLPGKSGRATPAVKRGPGLATNWPSRRARGGTTAGARLVRGPSHPCLQEVAARGMAGAVHRPFRRMVAIPAAQTCARRSGRGPPRLRGLSARQPSDRWAGQCRIWAAVCD